MVRDSGREHIENLHTHYQFKQTEIDNLQQQLRDMIHSQASKIHI